MHQNDISDYLAADSEWRRTRGALEKIAIDQHLRNITAEIARAGGDALSVYNHSPMLSSALTGAAVGGAVNTMRGDEEESKVRRFGRGAAGGAAAGLGTYLVAPGAVRNIGRMGEALSHEMELLRGQQRSPGRNVAVGEFGPALTRGLSSEARAGAGGRGFKPEERVALRDALKAREEATHALRSETDTGMRKTLADRLANAEDTISRIGGRGANLGAVSTAALLAATAAGGGAASDRYIQDHMNKESSARLARIVPGLRKQANIFAAGLGHLASGVGKAATTVAANPAAMGAVGGAVIGAGMAGEGNRLGGALAGATLGGGLGYGASKGLMGTGAQNFATGMTSGVQGFGSKMTTAGQGVVTAANAPVAQGATAQSFGQMVSGPFKGAFGAA